MVEMQKPYNVYSLQYTMFEVEYGWNYSIYFI